jgi:UDP-3-O-[3-hydroxymyristoyl] N-acetylglucosamine deacetylase
VIGSHQTTIKNTVECTGVGIHSGKLAHMSLKPAKAGTGILFRRLDMAESQAYVPARFDAVTDTRLGTTIANEAGVVVNTIEHLMAAFAGLGIDNALVELDGPEIPIMDGSAAPFVFLVECAGIRNLTAQRRAIRVLKRVQISEGEKLAELTPDDSFSVEIEIDFESPAIARQRFRFDLNGRGFKTEVARARTFGFRHEVDGLQARGLGRGGSLDNTIVIDGSEILNSGGLRYPNEFARHKLLDAIGDLYLAGAPILGHFRGVRSGHTLNNLLLRRLFARADAFEIVPLHVNEERERVYAAPAMQAAIA